MGSLGARDSAHGELLARSRNLLPFIGEYPTSAFADELCSSAFIVASNPKDWKIPYYMKEGIEGNDVAGYIEEVGEGVSEFKKGDKVSRIEPCARDLGRRLF